MRGIRKVMQIGAVVAMRAILVKGFREPDCSSGLDREPGSWRAVRPGTT